MKKKFTYFLIALSIPLFFAACQDDDDDDQPTTSTEQSTTTPTPGSGGGAGTGGGTGSGGIPPNSMKATIDGTDISFVTVQGNLTGNIIMINGFGANSYPQLSINMVDTITKGDYTYPSNPGEPYISYFLDTNTSYYPKSGDFNLRTIDTSRRLVNGRFNVVLQNVNDAMDTLVLTQGEFNRSY